jgi:putative transposon-encoded protein
MTFQTIVKSVGNPARIPFPNQYIGDEVIVSVAFLNKRIKDKKR